MRHLNYAVLIVILAGATACADAIDPGADPSGGLSADDLRRRRHDAGAHDGAVVPDASGEDAGAGGPVGAHGGTVDLLRFGVFGDVRPPVPDSTSSYPSAIFGQVIDGVASLGAQFVVASGDYMFATSAAVANAQVDLLAAAEARFSGHVFHALGNHECNGASTSNCPNGDETGNIQVFRARLAPAYAAPYYDWVVHTRLGDAHFVAAAPNAWSAAQQTWLTATLAQPARYTIVVQHEPPGRREAPGSPFVEDAISTRVGGVTLRLYGHTHEYAHPVPNGIITGNAGAPLASTSGSYGFAMVEQRPDGNLVVTAYDIGSPPTPVDSFVLAPDGSLAR